MLAAVAPSLAQATAPPPLLPCVPASPAVTSDAIGRIIAGKGDLRQHECAAKDLAARGAEAVPTALRLLRMRDGYVATLALTALADMGPQAQAALPALMERLRKPRSLEDRYLYDAVVALGPAAKPAIPLLIERSREAADPYYPQHTFWPLRALGRLGKHDADRVVPYLVSLLLDRENDQLVLGALADIGKDARAALPAILVALERAKVSGSSMDGAAALDALIAIGEPSESVPVLRDLLRHPVMARHAVARLDTLDPAAARVAPR
jgi:hypothetical protein